ncbi:MAG: hypothetical protein ACUVQF_04610 [Fervidobacterium sp.]|uniref:hypothetical protein n=1 Tax=Fervidobacterium sp. TaxID=1871331 RepID=UPI00404B189C
MDIIRKYIRNFFVSLGKNLFLKKTSKKVITVAIIHYDGKDMEKVLSDFSVELKSSDVIIGKNFSKEELKLLTRFERNLQRKHVLLIENDINSVLYHHGHLVNCIGSFDIKKLRSFEKHGTAIIVVNDKKLGWMISQMFPFYCIIPGEPFQETLITAPIPLTRNSDGYYFSKISYRNQVAIIDLNIEILSDFKVK